MTVDQYVKYNKELDRIERANRSRNLERENAELKRKNKELEKRLEKEKFDAAIRRANESISFYRKRIYEEKYGGKEKPYSHTYHRPPALASDDECDRCPFIDICNGDCGK